MKLYFYEYYTSSERVEIDIPDEEIADIAKQCKAEGDDREYFMGCVRDFINENKWDYETDRYEYGDRNYDDWDWDDSYHDAMSEIEDDYYSVIPVGEFGND